MHVRVCIDARLAPGSAGGVEQSTLGIAVGLSHLEAGDEEYFFLVKRGRHAWLKPYLGTSQLLVEESAQRSGPGRLRSAFGRLSRRFDLLDTLAGRGPIKIAASDGTIERHGIQVMHFAKQGAFLTQVPSIYQPHDLQHLHNPQFFSRRVRHVRERLYRTFCEHASLVIVMTSWGKRDLIERYGLAHERVHVVPWAPTVDLYRAPSQDEIATTRAKYGLPTEFLFYPAHTWAHKNHLGLLEALSILNHSGSATVPLVCTGGQTSFLPTIKRRIRDLGLTSQVRFTGYVQPTELMAMYSLARAVVFPSLFEGWGLPVLDAYRMGVPLACSNATSLPELAGDAAVLFDPKDPEQIAGSIDQVWNEEPMRQRLVTLGKARAAQFSWVDTARRLRTLHRLVAQVPLSAEDERLLTAPPAV